MKECVDVFLPVHIYHEIITKDIIEIVLSTVLVGNTTSGCSGSIVN